MEENENVAEEATQETVEQTTEPQVEEKQEESPVSINEDGDIKIDLTKIPVEPEPEKENETTTELTENNTDEGGIVENVQPEDAGTTQEQEEVQPETQTQEETTVDEVVDLPENLQKLMEFMEETGGGLEDYMMLNKNIEEMDDSEVLSDYYKQTKPHLNHEEINFLLEENFSYDEESDNEKEIKRKKIALKEQVAEAKAHLEESKSKYYKEIKAGGKLTSEQQKAIEFFNRYNQEEEQNVKTVENQQRTFLNKTDEVFKNFDGFEFNVGDKKIKYNITDVDAVKNKQVDINNFVGKFLNDGLMNDAAGYHKSLFTAMNPDAIAKHFYEQGRTDAVKQSVAESKNINTSRESHKVYEGEGGIKFRVLGEDSSDMKLRIKKRN
jgi:deoxyadenosine/deoxycytidine kinase|tara:strand:- start:703 stop:1848 length:1146 start_codon:yes stop_codon:yes gene_type:complete